jgi:hypothetical protein
LLLKGDVEIMPKENIEAVKGWLAFCVYGSMGVFIQSVYEPRLELWLGPELILLATWLANMGSLLTIVLCGMWYGSISKFLSEFLISIVLPSYSLDVLIEKTLSYIQLDDESKAWLIDQKSEWINLTPKQVQIKEILFILDYYRGVLIHWSRTTISRSLLKMK